jgi:3'-phosphoadenosine 5'-phosphosulfate sulfotransferase (PAPS reductase)/FAD synthetase
MPTKDELRILQAYPLEMKVARTKQRIKEWVSYYGEDGCYVSFSGGKDSTVLLHIARELYPNIEAVFVDTGLEYPQLREFVKSFDNVTWLKPKMSFVEVITKYGYPFISKEVSECVAQAKLSEKTGKYSYRFLKLNGTALDKNGNKSIYNIEKWKPLLYVDFNISNMCCNVMKKKPIHEYNKKVNKVPITAQMAEESRLREQKWLNSGCNGFNLKQPISNPMSFWTEQDILAYIKSNNLPIASVYGDIVYKSKDNALYEQTLCDCDNKLCTTGCHRTGCIFCGFGMHLEKDESRFERLKRTHPQLYDYCLRGGEYNESGIWQPKNGLGMQHIFDELNKIYGKDFIKY